MTRPSHNDWPSFRNGVQNFKEQISDLSWGNNHNEHLLLATRSTKSATEIEENTIKEAKTLFPTACPRGS